jgi:hypothetical protein
VPLAFDHVFCLVEPELREARVLEAAGFTLTEPHGHAGQGTGNRSVLFGNAYLELLHLRSREEAEANVLRLDRRADFASTGHCPFGICLRGVLAEEERRRYWAYRPEYRPKSLSALWIHRESTEHPGLPLLFVSEPWPGVTLETMHPGAWKNLDPRFLTHRNGATGIARVHLEVPDARRWPRADVPDSVVVEGGPRLHATVSITGVSFPPLAVNPRLTLVPA